MARPAQPHEGRHPLPAPEDFAATLGALGIGSDSTVVAYDDQGGAIAARLWWMLGWILGFRIPETLPDIYIPPFLTGTTAAAAFLLGVLAVALAPLLTWRKLSRMDVPAGLKVVE